MLQSFSLCVTFLLTLLSSVADAAVVEKNFTISWMKASPDGFERTVIGINGQWPPPTLYATEGDNIVVHVYNDLKNESTSLHFHGMFQNGTTNMDGSAGVSHCGIPPGSWMTYNFMANQAGTYWYHSHSIGQYPDGLRAPFIIETKEALPYIYDEEIIVTLSDWYHDMMEVLMPQFFNIANPTGAEPIPDSNLINDVETFKISIEPGKTYLIRMINVGAFVGQYVWFEGHNFNIVEVDGVFTDPQEADMVYLGVAQRCSILLTAKDTADVNFPFVAAFDEVLYSLYSCALADSADFVGHHSRQLQTKCDRLSGVQRECATPRCCHS
jgi:iron transport multicopper oxidase